MPRSKRTVADIQERYEDLASLWSARNAAIEEMRNLFFLNHYGESTKNAPNEGGVNAWRTPSRSEGSNLDANGAYRVTSSEYTDFALSIRSMMMAQAPIIRCYADKDTKIGDEPSQNTEKVLLGVRYVNRIRQERDFMDDLVHDTIVCGWSCVYSYWDEDFEKTYEDDNWRDFPLVVKAMPPEHCYPKPGGKRGRWREVLYAYEREIGEIEDEFDIKLSKTRKGDGGAPKDDDEKVMFYDDWWWEGEKV
jgi:hypothetical protein